MWDDWVERDKQVVWDENVTSANDADLKDGDKYLGKEGYDLENYYHSDGSVTPHSFWLGEVDVKGEMSDPARTMNNPIVKSIHETTDKWGEFIGLAMLSEAGGFVLSGAIRGISAIKLASPAAKTSTQGFKSFSAFKRTMGSAGEGQAWHHIVEQNPANIVKFGPEAIHNAGNVIKLPHGAGSIHAKVSGHYNSLMPGTSMRVRDYVNTLNYQQQYQYGLDVLKRFGY